MFLLRSIASSDLNDLLRLSHLMVFINLPPDEQIISKKINSSIQSFKKPLKKFHENYYIFVLEDLVHKKVVGVSMIHAQHGTEEEPHFFLKVGREKKFSQTINTGFIHGTLKLGLDTNGPTEIGGLIVDPEYRNHHDKLGKQISFVRFLYMSIYPERFKPTILSELMPPLDKDGNSPLWEAIGRRFMNMGYQEADILSRSNKEFILNLFPSETIYETLLPLEARNAIGKVGKETEPVRKMLKKIGFKYIDEVDPFDGGPHYKSNLKNISLIKNKFSGEISIGKIDQDNCEEVILSIPNTEYDFCAIKTNVVINGTKIIISDETAKQFKVKNGDLTNLIFTSK